MINDNNNVEIPEIYCSLSILLKKDTNINVVLDRLKYIGISDYYINNPKYEDDIYIDIAVIKNERNWYLNDVLTQMFLSIDNSLNELKELIDEYAVKSVIDIAFYQYGVYPALEFIGENMKKIRFLEAEISIDAY